MLLKRNTSRRICRLSANVAVAVLTSALLSACAASPSGDARLRQLATDIEQGGDYRTAAAMYQRVAEQTRDPDAYRQLGDTWLKAGEPARAETAYRQALTVNSGDAEALLGLGSALLEQSQPGFAAQALSKAAPRIDTLNAWSRLGVARAMLGEGASAEQAFRNALAKAPDNPDMQSNLALAQALAGDYATATAGLRRTVQSPVAQERHYRNLLLTLVLAGDLAGARRMTIPDLSPERQTEMIEAAERIRAIPEATLRARAMGFGAPAQAL